MDYDGMIRLHGREPRGRACGGCVCSKRPKPPYYEGHLHCKPEGAKFAHVVGEFWPACGHFKTPWQAERELLEQLGQKCIEFRYAGGVALRLSPICMNP